MWIANSRGSPMPSLWTPARSGFLSLTLILSLTGGFRPLTGEESPAGTARILLNALEEVPSSLSGWQVDALAGRLVADEPRAGRWSIRIDGTARQAGSKLDLPLSSAQLADFQSISLSFDARHCPNIRRIGLQIRDAEGEFLMLTQPLKPGGWQEVVWNRESGVQQSYPQPRRNGRLDLPIQGIQAIAFAESSGPVALTMDSLTARVTSDPTHPSLQVHWMGQSVVGAAPAPLASLVVENRSAANRSLTLDWSLRRNSDFDVSPLPHPTLGFDHATGAVSRVSVDGRDLGDARWTDGNDYTAFETPWGKGYRETRVDVDLGRPRMLRGLGWLAADANWIWNVDLATSRDGQTYTDVPAVQQFDMHRKWGENLFPWPEPREARWLRFRFYKPAESTNVVRLPARLIVYDGIENDDVQFPDPGPEVISGLITREVAAADFAWVELPRPEGLTPGSYLLTWTQTVAGRSERGWRPILVRPDVAVDPERTRRFGVNASNPALADLMSECGFGWVRFENGKWQMFCDAPDHYAFDGSIAPWHVNQDQIYEGYGKRGMQVLPYVFQTPEWATRAGPDIRQNRAGYPPRDPRDYGEAIFQMVARYGRRQVPEEQLKTGDRLSGLNRIQAVELWNEPNLVGPAWAPFVGPLDEYFQVMRAGVEGARRADPTLPVSGAGWAGTHLAVVSEMSRFKYPDGKRPIDLVDIVNVHFYSGRENPETCRTDPNLRKGDQSQDFTFPEQLRELIRWRNAENPRAEIWLTETGNDVGGPIGLSERHQAAKVPRVMMLALASGIEKVFVYRESGSDAAMHAGAGLVRNDGSLRPVWFTTATLIRQFQGFTGAATRLPHPDPNVWLLGWCEGNRSVVAAWTIGERQVLTRKAGSVLGPGDVQQVTDAFGQMLEGDRPAEPAIVTLTDFPRYLRIRPGSPTARAVQAGQGESK